MKTRASSSDSRHERGIMLFECLVYIGLLILIVGLGYQVVYRCWDFSISVRRATDEIARAVNAGEIWRQDVRSATGPLQLEDANGDQVVRIPHKSGEVAYRFSDGAMWRRAVEGASWSEVLGSVKSSRMLRDQRTRVGGWRWELELATKRKTKVSPIFTFESVPRPAVQP